MPYAYIIWLIPFYQLEKNLNQINNHVLMEIYLTCLKFCVSERLSCHLSNIRFGKYAWHLTSTSIRLNRNLVWSFYVKTVMEFSQKKSSKRYTRRPSGSRPRPWPSTRPCQRRCTGWLCVVWWMTWKWSLSQSLESSHVTLPDLTAVLQARWNNLKIGWDQ